MSKPVLIIQTSVAGYMAVKEKLLGAKLEPNDFIMFDEPFDIKDYIKTDENQLLITGSFWGDDETAAEFARTAKDMNPSLKIGYMSVSPFPGEPYDFPVRKFERGSGSVVDVVREYLAGE